MKYATAIVILVFLVPSLVSALEWKSLGFYKSYHRSFRECLLNPDNRILNLLKLKNWPNVSFAQYFSLQANLSFLQFCMDLLGEINYESDWENDLKLNQFYVQADVFDNWIFIIGRSIHRWGTGYAFNPTDVVAPDKVISDLENKEKQAVGNDMVKVEYYGETYSLALCYLTALDIGSKVKAKGSRLASRLYKNLGGLDISLISLFNQEESPIWGLNFACVIGNRLEIHGEVSMQRGSYIHYHRAIIEPDTLYKEYPFFDYKQSRQRLYNKYLLGFQYTFPGNILWIAEYYHQDQGYSKWEWRQIMKHAQFLNRQLTEPSLQLAEQNLLWTLNVFSPKGAMQDYIMNHMQIPVSEDVAFKSTWLMNLGDRSFLLFPEICFTRGDHFAFYWRSFIFLGNEETEFGELFQSFIIEGGVRLTL